MFIHLYLKIYKLNTIFKNKNYSKYQGIGYNVSKFLFESC